MGAHLIDGEFQSDKYPTTPRGKVPLSVKDKTAQDLLWEYAQRRRVVDAEFSDDLEAALIREGFDQQNITRNITTSPPPSLKQERDAVVEEAIAAVPSNWLDPFLSGKEAPPLPWNCPEIERLLNRVRDRIRTLKGKA